MTNMPELYSPEEVANILGVSPHTVRQWCRDSRIKALKVGRLWKVHRSEVDKIIEDGLPLDEGR